MSTRTEVTFICDRCNKNASAEERGNSKWGSFYASIVIGGQLKELTGKGERTSTDLCFECSKSLWRWWTNRSE